jgi:hypothetical protein
MGSGTISEYYESRPFQIGMSNGRELIYTIQGTDDETEVQALIFATAPGVYQGLSRDTVEAEPLGNGNWRGHAKYVRQDDDNEYTFETGGGTSKRTQSLLTAAYGVCNVEYYDYYDYEDYTGDEIPPDFGGAIGVDGDRVEGVDVTTPNYEFSETHLLADALVPLSYKLILFNLTGTINSATFKGFARGECLFLGATGNKRGDGQWSITYRFACSPNAVNLSVGAICGIDKLGWNYLWVRYDDFEDYQAYALVKRPRAAYVEQVYNFADFSQLGIGIT